MSALSGAPDVEHVLQLEARGRWVRAVITDVGAALQELSVGDIALTPPAHPDVPAPFFCGKILAPWPNRVRDGRWAHDDQMLQLAITDPVHRSALHGLLSHTAYQVVMRTESSITLRAPVTAQPGYPFALDTVVHYRLSAQGLEATQRIYNVGTACAPVGFGAHPFLAIGGVPTETLTLTINGRYHVDVDDRLLPVGVTPVEGSQWDLRAGRAVADLALDDCWAVAPEPDGSSTHTLRAPDGRSVSLHADAQFGFVHAFVTREFPSPTGPITAVAVEPVSAPADALNNGVGLQWLEPGESVSGRWAIVYHDALHHRLLSIADPRSARGGTPTAASSTPLVSGSR